MSITPDEAIIKAYDELLDKERGVYSTDGYCPICEDIIKSRPGSCTCNATTSPPCEYCESAYMDCEHTDREKFAHDGANLMEGQRNDNRGSNKI